MKGKHVATLGRHIKQKYPDEHRTIAAKINSQPSTSETNKKLKTEGENLVSIENYCN